MHAGQKVFCESVKVQFPQSFKGKRVLDCGSLDINGNNRYLFDGCEVIGIDIGKGPNVDMISRIHNFKSAKPFDTVISTECFEHDEFYAHSIENIVCHLLRPGGLFLFTCATTGRGEHGTVKKGPKDSPFTTSYYKNLTASDIPCLHLFERCYFRVNLNHCDLYFWGFKLP